MRWGGRRTAAWRSSSVDSRPPGAHQERARRPDDRWFARERGLEESPGSTGRRYRLTAGGRAKACSGTVPQKTNRLGFDQGKGETVRQERTAPRATGAAGQTLPGARPNRGAGVTFRRRHGGFPPCNPGWPREAGREARPRGMVIQVARAAGQNPAYRPPGSFSWPGLRGSGGGFMSSILGTGGRAVEGARLESAYTRERIVGSNPTLSASFHAKRALRLTGCRAEWQLS